MRYTYKVRELTPESENIVDVGEFTGCSRDLDFNPATTILKQMMKGKK